MKDGNRFSPVRLDKKPAPGDYNVRGSFDLAREKPKGCKFAIPSL